MKDEPQHQSAEASATDATTDATPRLANKLLQSIGSNALLLGLFALCCTG
ncbi:MAG: hypothetical protein HKO71_05195, partial [Pseudomonadales bacterium]|nr:hypothetical protein [Pseudomonadales bacterium]